MAEWVGPTSHSFISQRLRLAYQDWGHPEKPPLLLVHGGRDHSRSWDWVAQELRDDWHIIAPDLRGHGDSAWAPDGNYPMEAFVYDLAQLVHQLKLAPVTIVAHSLGGNISLRYAGLYPENVRKLVAIEGMGPAPKAPAADDVTMADQLRAWIDKKRAAAGRLPKRYARIEDALARMKAENGFLNDEQAAHLTAYGVIQNEDGSFSWKFDNHLNAWNPVDISFADKAALWGAITCPTRLCWGEDSWALDPRTDGRLAQFNCDVDVVAFPKAGHWLHHDQFAMFMRLLRDFL
jgi:pimeloyl-ACP methyl ester carboxylesterase